MYLDSANKNECSGCEACAQICGKSAISIQEDEEGFRYPHIDSVKCINCSLCRKVCPVSNLPQKNHGTPYVFGGYIIDKSIRFKSTSGGAFSAIVDAFCDSNYVVFGAASDKLKVYHTFIEDKSDLDLFRKSKYSQSSIGTSYKDAKRFLSSGKKVLFSGTPCQIAGLLNYIGKSNIDNLLTVEVVCEGVPSPLYIKKLNDHFKCKHGFEIETLDYRYTGKSIFNNGKWDFQAMKIDIAQVNRSFIKDRWFNPFWSIWLSHLMSRPSCYHCKFTTIGRVADITLGDLWGVHLYCPELYGKNGGSSLVVCNSEKGKQIFLKAKTKMYGHELRFEDALKYQSPMRKTIGENKDRELFMSDLSSDMSYRELVKKWASRPSAKLLFQKYIWGNRQKIFCWNLKNTLFKKGKNNA